MILLFACIAGTYLMAQIPPVAGDETLFRGLKITIDPGHGGEDPGAVAANETILEKDIVLDIGMCLEQLLRQRGAEVVLTRSDDRDLFSDESLPLYGHYHDFEQRKQIAIQNDSAIFLCIHANSFPESYCEGPQTFYAEDSYSGRQLALSIQEEMNRLLPNSRRFPQSIEQFVLEDMPLAAVTVEVGFMSNDAELQRLVDPVYQQKLSEAIVSGLQLFLERGSR